MLEDFFSPRNRNSLKTWWTEERNRSIRRDVHDYKAFFSQGDKAW